MTTVYKVVRRRKDGQLASAIIKRGKLVVIYEPGKPSYALNGMKLLAFADYDRAFNFHQCYHYHEIWEAEAKNVREQGCLAMWPWTWEHCKSFWEGTSARERAAPISTVACDSITLIKRVDKER